MAAQGATTKSGMLGTSRLAGSGANTMRTKASGLLGNSANTSSHIGELLTMVVVEMVILALIRNKLRSHHGG